MGTSRTTWAPRERRLTAPDGSSERRYVRPSHKPAVGRLTVRSRRRDSELRHADGVILATWRARMRCDRLS
jgi:hypothetical protein